MNQAPRTLACNEWRLSGGPDYKSVLAWRQNTIIQLRNNIALLPGLEAYYSERPWEFINHWVMTYDPRRPSSPYVPMIMFERQEEFVRFLYRGLKASGDRYVAELVDKSRDMGITWLCCGFSVWMWRFVKGSAVGWGSRKAELVDKIGDPDSIFEKIRILLRWMPRELLPIGFDVNDMRCVSHMRILNPNGASITGEAGDNIGRGGRKTAYFVDEFAHIERPELVEAALESNTNFRIDISTTAGLATVYQKKRDAGKAWSLGADLVNDRTNVFIFDWSDHPMKDRSWYEQKKAKAKNEGLLHLFAQEVDRDPAAAVFGTIIKGEWVRSAVGAREALGLKPGGICGAGLDVADEGDDLNAIIVREGIEAFDAQEWGERDVGVTTRRTIGEVEGHGAIEVQYDCIGVGAAVKAEANRLEDLRLMPKGVRFIAWSAAQSPLEPEGRVNEDDDDSPLNEDFFANLKAQAWWKIARRFETTHRARTEEGFTWNEEDIISLNPQMPMLQELMRQLSQPVMKKSAATLKMVVDKKPEGLRSPNLADAFIMAFWPVDIVRPMVINSDVMRNVRRRAVLRKQMTAMGYG